MDLQYQLANYLGLSVNQIAPNARRIFIGAEVIQGQLSGGNHQLTLDEFFYCYKPQHISSSQGNYHFLARKMSLRLMSNMPDSNKNWKNRYFFVQGTDQVCRPEEWDTMPDSFDNTQGIVKESGGPSVFFPSNPFVFHASNALVFLFNPSLSANNQRARGLHSSHIGDSS